MREKVKDRGRLEHILQACNILLENKAKYSREMVINDPIVFYGLVKLVEIIGEASYMLTKEFQANNPLIPWKEMVAMRHVLVHGYILLSLLIYGILYKMTSQFLRIR